MTLMQLKKVFKTSDRIFFYGCYDLPADPQMADRDQVNITADEIWRVTGYCFRYAKYKLRKEANNIQNLNKRPLPAADWP